MAWTRTDDLNGEPADQVLFGYDGKLFMVDLGATSKDKLAKALQPFLTVAVEYGHMPSPDGGETVKQVTPTGPKIDSARRRTAAAKAAASSGKGRIRRTRVSAKGATSKRAAAAQVPAPVAVSGANGAPSVADQATIRTWANANGYRVSNKGRIPDRVMSAWEARDVETTS